ncbi:MAG TPA: adenylate/guanylate cyclase domain-containing protein [Chthoniobacterales bacterium]
MHWLRRHRLLILTVICVFWTGLFLLGQYVPLPFVSTPWRLEQGFEDVLRKEGRKTPTRNDFVLLGIDQSTLEMPVLLPEEKANNRAFQLMSERPFPWSREVWALLLDKLFASGARLVMFDLVFDPPNDGDPIFAKALAKYRGRVVLGANIDLAHNEIICPNGTLVPPPPTGDPRVGYVNFWPDRNDAKLRSALFTISERQLAGLPSFAGDEVFESFAARGLEQLGHGADVPRDQQPHFIRFSEIGAYPPRTLYEVFDPRFWQADYQNGAIFKDKVVVIGATSQIAHDVVVTAMSPNASGPELHLQVMAAALAHEFLRPTSFAWMLALVVAAGTGAWLLVAFVRRPLICLLALALAMAAYLVLSRVLYDQLGFLLLTVPVLGAFLSSGSFSLGFEYVLERVEKLRTRRTLERYVSRNLVQEILDNPESFYSSLKGVRIPATVLFSDIVGFTSLTEHADPEALVRQLNEYLSRMTAAVFANGGTLDKFIGDAVMAVWGNVRSQGSTQDARMAARAALDMRRELKILNQDWHARGIAPFAIGIGINQGDVLCGNIGSQEKADPTVIGDAVNLASRLEGLTRIYGIDIILGPNATEFVRDQFHVRSVARVQVKGKSRPVEIATLIGERTEKIDPDLLRHLETYEEGFRKFRERDFRGAKILLGRFLESYPQDFLARTYLERSLEYEATPPEEAWNAVEIFQKK